MFLMYLPMRKTKSRIVGFKLCAVVLHMFQRLRTLLLLILYRSYERLLRPPSPSSFASKKRILLLCLYNPNMLVLVTAEFAQFMG